MSNIFLRKASVELRPISFTPQEQQVLDLLMAVVKNKSPATILRIAGGYVRDKLLGKDSNDIDIAINNMSGEAFATLVLEYMRENNIKNDGGVTVVKANPDQSKHLATAMVNIFGFPIDFVNLRKETYSDSRIPTTEPGTPEEDASRRDLTINSLFYNINTGQIEDFVGGIDDLKNGVARTPIDSVQTFIDDPLRILRSIRFAAKYNLKLSPEMIEAAKTPEVQEAFRNKISKERIWKELGGGKTESGEWKAGFMAGPDPAAAVRLLEQMGLRDILFELAPEEQTQLGFTQGLIPWESSQHNPHHDLTIWEHTLAVLENLVKENTTEEQKKNAEDYLVRNLSALLHDIGKCDICSIQMFPPSHPEYKEKVQALLDKYNLKHEGDLWTFKGHSDSSAKIAEHILQRMGAPSEIISRVKRIVFEHMRPHEMVGHGKTTTPSARMIRHFIKDLEGDWRHSLELAISDAQGKMRVEPGVKDKYIDLIERADKILAEMGGKHKVKPPISGHDLMNALGYKPGPLLGKALKHLEEQLLETPDMTKEEALDFVKSLSLI